MFGEGSASIEKISKYRSHVPFAYREGYRVCALFRSQYLISLFPLVVFIHADGFGVFVQVSGITQSIKNKIHEKTKTN